MIRTDTQSITNPYLRAALERPARVPPYRIADRRAVYEADWIARPTRTSITPENQNVLHAMHDYGFVVDPPFVFNWSARLGSAWLISGDLPRLALSTLYGDVRDQQIHTRVVLGDVRIRVTTKHESFWLHERGRVRTRYQPWGTVHDIILDAPTALRIVVTATLAESHSIAISTTVSAPEQPSNLTLEYVIGALQRDWTNAIEPNYIQHKMLVYKILPRTSPL